MSSVVNWKGWLGGKGIGSDRESSGDSKSGSGNGAGGLTDGPRVGRVYYVKYGVLGWMCVISGCVSSFGSSGGKEEAVLDCELDLSFHLAPGLSRFQGVDGETFR